MYARNYKYLKNQSFFLFGPSGTGKTILLKKEIPNALYIDLLDKSLFQEYVRDPNQFKKRINTANDDQWIIVDEIQRVPHSCV